jgi:hypothetical protein
MLMLRGFKRTLCKGAIAAIALVLAVLLVAPKAQAADFNLTASPLPINLITKPGGSVSTPLRVQNTGTETVKVKVSLLKFKANGTSGKPEILDPSPGDDYIKWVSFSETSFQAEPNVWHTVNMTIKAPKEAAFGYYYAVIFSQDDTKQRVVSDKQHNTINGAVATLVLLDVNAPGEKRELSVTKFMSQKRFYEYLPASFTITVHNSGNVHAAPSGDVFISRNHKDTLAALQINAAQGNILPGTSREFTVQWDDGFPRYQTKRVNGQVVTGSDGKPQQQLNWKGTNLGKLRIGKYYAHLVLVYNDGTRDIPVEGELSFWVIPWRLLALVIFLVVLPLVLGTLLVRQRRQLKKLKGQLK